MSAQADFEIIRVTDQDTDKLLQYMRKYFYTEEPLNRYLNRQRNETVVPPTRGLNIAKTIEDGLSLMAVTPSNEVIGAAINKKVQKEGGRQLRIVEDHPNFAPIVKFVLEVEAQAADFVKLGENEEEMSVYMISVHPEWRNKRIGALLIQKSMDIARQNGFNQIEALCSSAYSANLFEKFGFRCVFAMNYEDYKDNGEVVFKPDAPHTQVKIMIYRI